MSSGKKGGKYNTIPKRNYIDLRMEQNRLFADDQCIQCRKILSKLQQSSSSCNDKPWKKQGDTIQSLINEGLAACPNHEGLLSAERMYKGWIQRRIDSLPGGDAARSAAAPNNVSNSSARASASAMKTANTTTVDDNNNNKSVLPNPYPTQPKKGAEGRAHAAMRDALMERSFMLSGDAGKGKDDAKYPLLSAGDEFRAGEAVREEEEVIAGQRENGLGRYSSDDSSVARDGRSRSRSRRRWKSKHKRHKSGKRRYREGRKLKREQHQRSRGSKSESGSASSRSRSRHRSDSSVSTRGSSSYRRQRKHHRRKEKKRRRSRHRKRSRGERHQGGDDDENEDSGEEKGGKGTNKEEG